jgi:hypothetical protein
MKDAKVITQKSTGKRFDTKGFRRLKHTHLEGADEVIISISEVLQRASGEEIEAAAKAAGLTGIKYVRDSMFEVEEK